MLELGKHQNSLFFCFEKSTHLEAITKQPNFALIVVHVDNQLLCWRLRLLVWRLLATGTVTSLLLPQFAFGFDAGHRHRLCLCLVNVKPHRNVGVVV